MREGTTRSWGSFILHFSAGQLLKVLPHPLSSGFNVKVAEDQFVILGNTDIVSVIEIVKIP